MEPKLELRDSTISGTGCYALEDIPKGTRIGEYTGEIITDDEADRRLDESDDHTYLFSIEGGRCIDATHEKNYVKYVNHSCDPNCEAEEDDGKIFYYAIRTIKKNEELTVDYQLVADDDDLQECQCGAVNCRRTMKPARA